MKAKQYAEALFLATRAKSDAELDRIATQFQTLLTKRGHLALLPAVVRELDKLFAQRNNAAEIVIRVANLGDAETQNDKIEADIRTLNATPLPKRILVDTTLIGGYEVRAQGHRIDRTYKRSLLTLYTNLITNNQ
ncbi:TPA: hypothetical protein DEP58_02780 [Patescibacteria group bacterium]|nr:MAG: hypothetical protein UU98_C0027G0017 [Parcubacteria group bacterium GW2011_GWD2_42_14]HCC05208.1 hypothetical protein [Patescibacteria group bacterium]